ncbi:MAG: DHH family phosphoesterase [Clostridiaceae bacterium]|nr:DHH family phosphoesterase [Clostridiaceae bacterium]
MDKKFNYFKPSNKVYMVIMAIFIAILFLYQIFVFGIIALIVYAILIVYNIKDVKIKKDEWKSFIEDFSSKLDTATKSTLVKLPFPLIIVGKDGNILWYNQSFSSVMGTRDTLGISANEIFKEFNVKKVLEGKEIIYKHIALNDRNYDVYCTNIDTKDKNNEKDQIILLYLYDVTLTYNLERETNETKEGVMLIEVDNLDEALKTIEEDQKPLFIAEIERLINSYGQGISAMLKKYSSDKYILSVQERNLKNEINKKFDILDAVRELNLGNQLAVTLSIGIGRGGNTPLDNYNFALAAKDLALGRGGDQAVIKSGEKLAFYGGLTKEVEKRTKVRARVIAHALVGLIKESSNVFIMGHVNPDVDCLGAAVGLNIVATMLNKKCYIILENVNSSLKNIMDKIMEEESYKDTFINAEECKQIIDEKSLIILVDVHNKGYVQNPEIMALSKKFVMIDHHRKSQDCFEGAIISYIEPYASSASEMVTEMLQYMVDNPKIKQIEAEALLAGICVDTKNFYFKTGVRTFEAASFLRRLGADTIDIKKMFSNNLETYIKKADIIKSAMVEKNIAIAVCPAEITDSVIAAQAADELLNITGIQASFVIVKIDKDVFISGRSLGDINVQVILEDLGGGGHMTMAGTRFQATTEEAVKMLKDAIDKYLREGEK